MRRRMSTSADELWSAIQEDWDAIPISTVDKLVVRMEKRRLAVIKYNG